MPGLPDKWMPINVVESLIGLISLRIVSLSRPVSDKSRWINLGLVRSRLISACWTNAVCELPLLPPSAEELNDDIVCLKEP